MKLAHGPPADHEDVVPEANVGFVEALNHASQRLTKCDLVERALGRHREQLLGRHDGVIGQTADPSKGVFLAALEFADAQMRVAAAARSTLHATVEERNRNALSRRKAMRRVTPNRNDFARRFVAGGNRVVVLRSPPQPLLHRAQRTGADPNQRLAAPGFWHGFGSQLNLTGSCEDGNSIGSR